MQLTHRPLSRSSTSGLRCFQTIVSSDISGLRGFGPETRRVFQIDLHISLRDGPQQFRDPAMDMLSLFAINFWIYSPSSPWTAHIFPHLIQQIDTSGALLVHTDARCDTWFIIVAATSLIQETVRESAGLTRLEAQKSDNKFESGIILSEIRLRKEKTLPVSSMTAGNVVELEAQFL